jgi:RNA polymerase sigma factor (TIGR02999 family)
MTDDANRMTSPFRCASPVAAGEVTLLLGRLGGADDPAIYDRLLPLIQDELRHLAAGFLQKERPDHTLQPTALVNEAFLRLADQREVSWESKGHFLAIAATAMRRILVDHARAHRRRSRDGERASALLESDATAAQATTVDLLSLDEAMTRLARLDPRKVKVVELRYFVGMNVEQTAAALGISTPTVKREWRLARVWLKREIAGDG